MKRLAFSGLLTLGLALELQPDPYSYWKCEVCYLGVSSMNTFLLAPAGDSFWVKPALDICKGSYANDECDRFGKKAVNFFVESVMAFHLQPTYMCEEWIKMCKTDYYKPLKISDYTDRVLSDKPKSLANDDVIQKEYDQLAE